MIDQIKIWHGIWDNKTILELYDLHETLYAQTRVLDGSIGITNARKRLSALTTYILARENAEAREAEMVQLFGSAA